MKTLEKWVAYSASVFVTQICIAAGPLGWLTLTLIWEKIWPKNPNE